MNLAHLSMVRLGHRVPHNPTPEERLAAYRAVVPPTFANNFPWKWRADYAREQSPVEPIDTYEHRRGV